MTSLADIQARVRPLGLPRARCGTVALRGDRIRLRTVVADGALVGHVVDVLLEPTARRVAGFQVRTPERQDWFVPIAAVVAVGPTGIEMESALHVVAESDFYREAGIAASDVLGAVVRHGAREARIDDISVCLADGDVHEVVLDDGGRLPGDLLGALLALRRR